MSDSDEPADRPLRILHVTPAFYPATYWGGPIFSTYGLCNALAAQEGIDVTVLTTDSAGPGRDDRLQISATPERYSAGYDVHFVRKSRGKDIAPRMFGPLKQLARQADILHLTATYSFPTFPVFFAARQLNKPLVWSPRGAIQATAEWGAVRRRRLKQAWAKLARVGLPKQTLFHTTADVERDACAEAFPGVPAIVVPNGVDVPDHLPARDWKPEGHMRLMFLSRLDSKKGLENLLDALSALRDTITLDVYGSGSPDYEAQLKTKVAALRLSDRVTFHGHTLGDAKARAFSRADLFVLPSYSENFGIVIAEALAHGVPVITSRATPWEEIEAQGCGLWIENTPDALSAGITSLQTADLADMGQRGRVWVKSTLAWDALASTLAEAYKTLAGKPPAQASAA